MYLEASSLVCSGARGPGARGHTRVRPCSPGKMLLVGSELCGSPRRGAFRRGHVRPVHPFKHPVVPWVSDSGPVGTLVLAPSVEQPADNQRSCNDQTDDDSENGADPGRQSAPLVVLLWRSWNSAYARGW